MHGGEKSNRERTRHTAIYQDFGGEVFKDGRGVNSSLRADAKVFLRAPFEASTAITNGELEPRRPCDTTGRNKPQRRVRM